MTTRPLWRIVALSAIALAYACANLPDVSADTCGNRVVEAREDCDTFDVGKAQCGAKGTPTACRLLCTATAATAQCPSGWGCGTDGVCRAPSGQFDLTFTPVPSGQARLQLGDFDGDGRQDLFASSVSDLGRPEIHFIDDSAQIAQTLLVGASIRAPQVSRALTDDDGLDDIAFASSTGGVDILLGQDDRTVVPVAYPTNLDKTDVAFFGLVGSLADGSLPVTSSASSPTITHGLAVIVGSAGGQPLFAGSDLATNIPLNIPPGVTLNGRGDIVDAAVIKVLPGSVCGELLLLAAPQGGKGLPELDIIPICRKEVTGKVVFNDATGGAILPIRVELAKVAALKLMPITLAVGDMDDDGQKDIVVNFQPQQGAAPHAPYVYNVKTGTLTELVYTLRGMAVGGPVRGNPIIAAGDFNADTLTDVVFSDMIAFGTTKPVGLGQEFVPYVKNTGDPWTQAIVSDLNADGFLDIAAISPSRTLIDFFVGAPGGFFSAGTLPTSGSVARIGVGDYDGDNVLDLGVLVRASADSAGGDVLLAYGRRQGLPENPRRVASFQLANDLTTIPALHDVLTVVGNEPTGPTTAVAVLIGDADRFPLAVKGVADVNNQAFGPGLAVVAGPLKAKGQTDMAVLYGDLTTARSSGIGVVIAPQGANFQGDLGVFSSIVVPTKDATKAILVGTDTADAKANRYLANTSVPLAVDDINGDGVAEVYIVSGTVGGKSATIARLSAAGRQDLAQAPAPFGAAGKLLFVDVDGDHAKDLVYISGFTSVQPARFPGDQTKIVGSSTMTVFFNDGQGTLSKTGVPVTNVAVSGGQSSADGGDGGTSCATFADPTAIANIRVDAGGASRVAVLTAKCLYVGTIERSGAGHVQSILDRTLSVGFSLAVGDMSGDGVDEIAFLDDRSLTILKQRPVLP